MVAKRVIALSGGIGSGKSAVAELFRAHGVPIIDADVLARDVVSPGEPALAEILATFGPAIMNLDGTLNRRALASVIFSDTQKRKQLEDILHPRIRSAFTRKLLSFDNSPAPFVIYVMPLFFEAENAHPELEKVIVVWAPEELCITRVMNRDRLNRDDALLRVRAQLPIDEKSKRADWVIKNDGDESALPAQVEKVYSEIIKLC